MVEFNPSSNFKRAFKAFQNKTQTKLSNLSIDVTKIGDALRKSNDDKHNAPPLLTSIQLTETDKQILFGGYMHQIDVNPNEFL